MGPDQDPSERPPLAANAQAGVAPLGPVWRTGPRVERGAGRFGTIKVMSGRQDLQELPTGHSPQWLGHAAGQKALDVANALTTGQLATAPTLVGLHEHHQLRDGISRHQL